ADIENEEGWDGFFQMAKESSARLLRSQLARYSREPLYQVEVNLALVRSVFSPRAGWRVTVDIDGSEMGKGMQQPRGKAGRARAALKELRALGVTIGPDDRFGR